MIKAKSAKRYAQITDYLHKASRYIIHYCQTHNLGTIIIGKNDQWKQSITMGKVNNQKFVSVPHNRLIEQIRYKAQSVGITVIVREESYTSKASALDHDPIPTYGDKKKTKKSFSGKRIKRGLYQSKERYLINADVNGAYNIMRKELGDKVSPLSNKGCVNHPVRVSFHNVNHPKIMRARKIISVVQVGRAT